MPSNTNTLALTPEGHLLFRSSDKTTPIAQAFNQSLAAGILFLVANSDTKDWVESWRYWRDFGVQYITQCTRLFAYNPQITSIPTPNIHTLERYRLKLPVMPGAEYCTVDVLIDIWEVLDAWVCDKIATQGLQGFLSETLPCWHPIGRVCFHLAENKQDKMNPFAFLATYAAEISDDGCIQYQPLQQALEAYSRHKSTLIQLLNPLYQAAQRCDWLKGLIDTGDIYHPLAWSAQDAYALLNSVGHLEASGIIVHLPDWWKKRSRVRVQLTIGHTSQHVLNADTLMDFQLQVALGGETLTLEEREQLLQAKTGLLSLRGQWVAVDAEKLQTALQHWQGIETTVAAKGLSFTEGMRLLAGIQPNGQPIDDMDEQVHMRAGQWLQSMLTELRSPEKRLLKPPDTLMNVQLRPYQLTGLKWLDSLTRLGLGACLADDMGLGKTLQVIALLLHHKQVKTAQAPSLLILPASLLSNWQAEITRFAPGLTVDYLHASYLSGDAMATLAASTHLNDLVITTYSTLLRQSWLQERSWHLVILDEAQAIKNPVSRQTKAVKSLRAHARIALTGTPIENRLGDLWSLFDFLCPMLLGSAKEFKAFIKQFEQQETPNYGILRKLIQPYLLRRLKTDKRIMSDLPEKTHLTVWCGLTKEQAMLYTQAVKQLQTRLATIGGIERRGIILSFLTQFKQICNHPAHYLNDGNYDPTRSGKFLRLREIAQEIASRQGKVLVFTQYRTLTTPLSLFLSTCFGQTGLVLHGGIPIGQRQKLVESFQQEDGPPFFVLSLKTAGTGLNLTQANHVIHFDRWWNPAVENQATDRAFRIGQKKNVLVHQCVCRGTLEEKIDQLIQEKAQLAQDLLSESKPMVLTEMDDRALMNLVSLNLDQARF